MGRAGKSSDRVNQDQGQSQGIASADVASTDVEPEPESIRLAVKLPPKQRIAADALGLGLGAAEAARRAKVDRTTVSRWLNHDAKFIAAYNALILDNIKSSRAEMASLLPLASAAPRKELEKGNGWLALQFYREARSLGLLEVGPTSPEAVKEELKLAQQIHEAELARKQMQLHEQKKETEQLRQKMSRDQEQKEFDEFLEEDYAEAWFAFKREWDLENRIYDQQQQLVKEHEEKLKEEQKQEEPAQSLSADYCARRGRGEFTLQYESSKQYCDLRDKLEEERRRVAEERNARRFAARQRAAEIEQIVKQQPHEPSAEDHRAEDQRPAVEQPSVDQQTSSDEQPAPEPHRRDEQDRDEHHQEAEHREVGRQAATADRPAAEHRPADDSAKSNPDIEPPAGARSEQDPPGAPTALGDFARMDPSEEPPP